MAARCGHIIGDTDTCELQPYTPMGNIPQVENHTQNTQTANQIAGLSE